MKREISLQQRQPWKSNAAGNITFGFAYYADVNIIDKAAYTAKKSAYFKS